MMDNRVCYLIVKYNFLDIRFKYTHMHWKQVVNQLYTEYYEPWGQIYPQHIKGVYAIEES